MDSNQLEIFIQAAECLNFSSVAKRNYMSQPTVSKYISDMEMKLGAKLFHRIGHNVSLTSEGESFLTDAKDILSKMHDASIKIQRQLEGKSGRISIGMVSTSTFILTKCLAEFSRQYSDVQVDISTMTGVEMEKFIRENKFDIVFTDIHMMPEDDTCDYVISGQSSFLLAVPAKHPLQELPAEFSSMEPEPFVIINMINAPTLHNRIIEVCRNRSFIPNVVSRHNRIESVLLSVSAGVGISILPDVIIKLFAMDGIKSFPIPGEDCIIPSVILWKKQMSNTAALRFIDVVLRQYPD